MLVARATAGRYLDNPPGTPGATTSSTSIPREPAPEGGAQPTTERPEPATTTPGTIPIYAPAEDAEGCVDPPLT